MFICPVNRLFAAPVLHLDTSVIMSSTLESDIYNPSEQLEVVATSNYLCPYLPDLKNHFMTIGNNSGGEKEKKSRGTFSPRKATPFKTRTTDYERL